jgi:hypothetical protein
MQVKEGEVGSRASSLIFWAHVTYIIYVCAFFISSKKVVIVSKQSY